MSLPASLFVPLLLLLPVAGLIDSRPDAATNPPESAAPDEGVQSVRLSMPPEPVSPSTDFPDEMAFNPIAKGIRGEPAQQVRIEQRVIIRITPRPMPMRPDMMLDLPPRDPGPHFEERKIGNCVPASGIAGVQTDGDSRLILFMRDQRIIRAELGRACRARDFYSGFYIARTADGQLCVNRDTLLARNGATCKLKKLRQLVEKGD
jgi:hypothetical protein